MPDAIDLEGRIIHDEGTKLDFKLVQKLGSGACGQVYRAEAVASNRERLVYAFKFPLDSKFNDHIKRAGKLMESFGSHPNVVEFKGYGSSRELHMPYLKLEFIDGYNFGDYISWINSTSRGINPAENLRLIFQAMGAMEMFHSKGIIHLDLTPSNVMVRKDGVVKITDFEFVRVLNEWSGDEFGEILGKKGGYGYRKTGLARKRMDGNRESPVIHDHTYIAPEVISEKLFTPSADVYSISKLLFLSLTGKDIGSCPFDVADLLEKSGFGFLNPVVRKGMDENMCGRFKSVAEMRSEIEKVMVQDSMTGLSSDYKSLKDMINSQPSTNYVPFGIMSVDGVRAVGEYHMKIAQSLDSKLQSHPISSVETSLLKAKNSFLKLVTDKIDHDLTVMFDLFKRNDFKGKDSDIRKILAAWEKYPVPEAVKYARSEPLVSSKPIQTSRGPESKIYLLRG